MLCAYPLTKHFLPSFSTNEGFFVDFKGHKKYSSNLNNLLTKFKFKNIFDWRKTQFSFIKNKSPKRGMIAHLSPSMCICEYWNSCFKVQMTFDKGQKMTLTSGTQI